MLTMMVLTSSLIMMCLLLNVAHSDQHCDTSGEACDSDHAAQIWENGIVKYELHFNLTLEDKNSVFQAFHEIQKRTCIRFLQRQHGDTAYVKIFRNNDLVSCGTADLCQTHSIQHVILGNNSGSSEECPSVVTSLLNLLGKSLCRDEIQAVKNTLSTVDAEQLNLMYNCQGCFRHRWRKVKDLTENEISNLLTLGETYDGNSLYLCRAIINGEILPGKFIKEENKNKCFVTFNGAERSISGNETEVFTVPNTGSVATTVGHYSRVHVAKIVSNPEREYMPLPVGKSSEGVELYAAVAKIHHREDSVGKVYANKLDAGYFPFQGEEVRSTNYQLLTCHEKLKEFSEIDMP